MAPEGEEARELGDYRLVERLGAGGMGAVYRAVHKKLGRTVAIKVLQKDLTSDRGIINRFFHEARAANTIRHEHVVEVYDFVEDGSDVYFVMEFLKGQDLHDAIHRDGRTPMSPVRAAGILEQIASALHAAHAHDIVHRDLKPENVFLTGRDGLTDYVKVFDFGIAKLDRPDGRSTVEGAILGTPEYMSPEQARGLPIDGRADVYSLGCIAYEMLTRHQLFGGGTQAEVLVRQISVSPPPMSRFVSPLSHEVPPALEAVVMRALAKDPKERPQTAMAFAEGVAEAMGRTLEDSGAFHSRKRTPARLTPPPGLVLRGRTRRITLRPVLAGLAVATLLTAALWAGKRQVTSAQGGGKLPPSAQREDRTTQPVPKDEGLPTPSGDDRPTPLASAGEGQPAPMSLAGGAKVVTVVLQSTPSGAEVLDEAGRRLGVTPFDLFVHAGGERTVRFSKPGFRTLERRVQPRTDGTVSVFLDADTRRAARLQGHTKPRPPRTLDSAARTIDPFSE